MSIQRPAARFVREIRERSALTQRDLASAAGTAQSVVGRIEADLTSPTIDSLERLAHAAGFDLRIECTPRRVVDPVVEAYKPGVDRTLLISNLRKSPRERFEQLLSARRFILKVRRIGEESRRNVAEPEREYGQRDE